MVFDKVRENARGVAASGRMTYSDTVNLSMNQVLMRSLNTSLVAILPILSILVIGAGIMGATILKDFGLALLVGLLTGAYSSIFIASPLLAMLKEREPRYVNVRQRLAAKGGSPTTLTPAAAAALAGAGGGGWGRKAKAKAAGAPTATPAKGGGAAKAGAAKPGPSPGKAGECFDQERRRPPPLEADADGLRVGRQAGAGEQAPTGQPPRRRPRPRKKGKKR